jgi:RND superfamily putative drug exporter
MTSPVPTTDDDSTARPRRRARLIAWGVVVAWAAAVIGVLPLAMELEDVQTDRSIDYLPASADSTRVAELVDQLPGGDAEDYLVVYYRDGGITEADRATVARHRAALEHLGRPSSPTGESEPLVSRDGTALLFTLPVDPGHGDPEEVVTRIREVVAERPSGLDARVTGPAALEADLDEVFDGIDETLLLATISVVTLLLILTYRSPLLWLLPLVAVGAAAIVSMAMVSLLAQAVDLTVSTQSASILVVLVFGAGTDYALLLVARYREHLRSTQSVPAAVALAVRGAGPAILASAGTVMAGLLCLLAADLNSSRGLGPVGAIGIAATLAAMLTLFPALLVLVGRPIFWPRVPRYGSADHPTAGWWTRLGRFLERRRIGALAGGLAVLGVLSLGLTGPTHPLRDQDQFLTPPESVAGYVVLAEHYPELDGQPLTVLTRPSHRDQVLAVVTNDPGIAQAVPGAVGSEWAEITAFPTDAPDTPGETATIRRLRQAVAAVPGADALVGGPSAQNVDQRDTSSRDRTVVMPLILGVILVILLVLLRALVAPLVMVASVILSYVAALGASVIVFDKIFGFAGIDHSVPLLGFLFLIALGVDYTIFLMSRAREEATRHGTRTGTLRALAATGGVITSAGLVLAATFAVLATLPLVMMVELGFLVAFGVLLDTFLVRSIVVPAIALLAGRRIWWPGRLARHPDGY